MYGYVYLTTNLINDKKYIGQHKGRHNPNYLGSGLAIVDAVTQYGKENFKNEVLCYCDSKEQLDLMEVKFIEEHNAVRSSLYYNMIPGGTGGVIYESRSGESNPMFGKKQSELQKEKARLATKGKKRPPEVIAKWSETQRGKKLSDEHKKKLGKKQTILDTETNKVYTFDSVKEAYTFCGCGDKTYHTARKEDKLIKKRYKVIEEENKYGKN